MKLPWCAALAAASLSAQTFAGAPALDEAINQAIAQDRLPGAVLVVGHNGQIVYRKAYGKRALVPQPETMTLDTIFDCASLTKVIATTPSLMKLFEQGKFRLNDEAAIGGGECAGGGADVGRQGLGGQPARQVRAVLRGVIAGAGFPRLRRWRPRARRLGMDWVLMPTIMALSAGGFSRARIRPISAGRRKAEGGRGRDELITTRPAAALYYRNVRKRRSVGPPGLSGGPRGMG